MIEFRNVATLVLLVTIIIVGYIFTNAAILMVDISVNADVQGKNEHENYPVPYDTDAGNNSNGNNSSSNNMRNSINSNNNSSSDNNNNSGYVKMRTIEPLINTPIYDRGMNQEQQKDVVIADKFSFNNPDSNTFPELVIINFDDSYNSQIDYATPILDKYGFKATFFEICDRINENGWEKILKLKKNGMDIQAHTMTHPNLNELSSDKLEYELGDAKECFLRNGIDTSIFAYPYGNGWNNLTVLESVANHYDLARTNSKQPLTFLNCDHWKGISYDYMANDSSNSMPSCFGDQNKSADGGNATHSSSRIEQVLGSSRYAINSWSHKHIEGSYDYSRLSCADVCQYYNNSQMFERFIEVIKGQDVFNKDGTVRAIPIIVYHAFVPYDDISESDNPTDTSVYLFEKEMRYLYENGVKVLTMSDLAYDENRGTLVIRPSPNLHIYGTN